MRPRADWDAEWECGADGCSNRAVEVLVLRGQGHVHDCASCAAVVREFCDVVDSRPMTVGGSCPMLVCTPYPIANARPVALPESDVG